MEGLIVRSEAELSEIVENIVAGISAGLADVNQRGSNARMVSGIQISGTFIKELSAATIATASVTPEIKSSSKETKPAVTTTTKRTTPATTVIEESTPPGRFEKQKTTSKEESKTNNSWIEFAEFL